jgi:hypothetical protein
MPLGCCCTGGYGDPIGGVVPFYHYPSEVFYGPGSHFGGATAAEECANNHDPANGSSSIYCHFDQQRREYVCNDLFSTSEFPCYDLSHPPQCVTACCHGGRCEVVSLNFPGADCHLWGADGKMAGPGTTCDQFLYQTCAPACCLNSGGCSQLTHEQCLNVGRQPGASRCTVDTCDRGCCMCSWCCDDTLRSVCDSILARRRPADSSCSGTFGTSCTTSPLEPPCRRTEFVALRRDSGSGRVQARGNTKMTDLVGADECRTFHGTLNRLQANGGDRFRLAVCQKWDKQRTQTKVDAPGDVVRRRNDARRRFVFGVRHRVACPEKPC